jgi:hypothetical protein
MNERPVQRPDCRAIGARPARLAGRADVRQALYMPALVAARFNPDMRRNTHTSSKPENPQKSP